MELIVVVTILAILATIGFVSYSSYLTGVRDTNRIAQMTSLSDGLNLYSTRNDLPIPEDNVEVSVNGNLIAYQGYAGANILETINFEKGGVDPKDNTYFSYYLTRDRKYFQLMGFLEESADLTTLIPSPSPLEEKGASIVSLSPKGAPSLSLGQTQGTQGGGLFGLGVSSVNAANYQNRIPTVTGKKLGILTDTDNTPIQELGVDLDITDSTTGYIARLTNNDVVEDGGLLSINPKASCKRLKQMNGRVQDGVYKINPEGNNEFEVYCDMTTDGGGWTYLVTIDGSEGILYGNDLWWDPNYSGDEFITKVDDRSKQGVYQAFYSLSVSELSMYAEDGGYSIYQLNDGYEGKNIQALISQVSGENGASQNSGGSTGHAKVHVGDRISTFQGLKKNNCPITYGAGEKLSMLASHSVYLPHTSIFSVAPTTNVPRSSLFGGGTAVGLGYVKAETASGQVSQVCLDNGDMWQDESYVVLMGR